MVREKRFLQAAVLLALWQSRGRRTSLDRYWANPKTVRNLSSSFHFSTAADPFKRGAMFWQTVSISGRVWYEDRKMKCFWGWEAETFLFLWLCCKFEDGNSSHICLFCAVEQLVHISGHGAGTYHFWRHQSTRWHVPCSWWDSQLFLDHKKWKSSETWWKIFSFPLSSHQKTSHAVQDCLFIVSSEATRQIPHYRLCKSMKVCTLFLHCLTA